jgi:hypothetical protein
MEVDNTEDLTNLTVGASITGTDGLEQCGLLLCVNRRQPDSLDRSIAFGKTRGRIMQIGRPNISRFEVVPSSSRQRAARVSPYLPNSLRNYMAMSIKTGDFHRLISRVILY